MDDGAHTVEVQILEAHRLLHVQPGPITEVNTSSVHQLLTLLTRWVHGWVRVQVLNVIKGLHVVPEVHVSKDRCEQRCKEQRDRRKRVPHWIAITLFGPVREQAT